MDLSDIVKKHGSITLEIYPVFIKNYYNRHRVEYFDLMCQDKIQEYNAREYRAFDKFLGIFRKDIKNMVRARKYK